MAKSIDEQSPLKDTSDSGVDIELATQNPTIQIEDEKSIFDHAKYKALKAFSNIVVPLYIILFFGALGCCITASIGASQPTPDYDPHIFGFITFILTLVGATMGAWGTYKFGTIEEHLETMKKENIKFGQSIDDLKDTRKNLTGNVNEIQKSVESMQTEGHKLEENIKEFDDLLSSLTDLESDSKEILEMVDNLNNMASDMQQLAKANKRAALLETYYQFEYGRGDGGDDAGLSKREYQKFLNKLDKNTRAKFERNKSFKDLDKDNDGTIDLKEIQIAINDVLDEDDIDAVDEFKEELNNN